MKSLPTPVVISGVILFALIASYFGLTWFFFGSSHPCGILEARQRPFFVERAIDSQWKLIQEQWDSIDDSIPKEIDIPADVFKKFAEGKATRQEREAVLLKLEFNKHVSEIRLDASKEKTRLIAELKSIPQEVSLEVGQRVWSLTPAQCLWQAITWKAPRGSKQKE